MKVYELIQELAQYDADTEVRFHIDTSLDVHADFDRDNENDTQEVTVDIDEDFEFDDIDDHENTRYGNKYIQINLTY